MGIDAGLGGGQSTLMPEERSFEAEMWNRVIGAD
jgi:hypothetical protein